MIGTVIVRGVRLLELLPVLCGSSCAGESFAWGGNSFGQCGNGSVKKVKGGEDNILTPTMVRLRASWEGKVMASLRVKGSNAGCDSGLVLLWRQVACAGQHVLGTCSLPCLERTATCLTGSNNGSTMVYPSSHCKPQ